VAQLPELARAIAPTLHTLDALIDPSGTALGRFTIADVAAAPVLFRTTKTGLELSPYPNVERWRDTVTARPAFAAAEPII
jgi:glutathione S-transferase